MSNAVPLPAPLFLQFPCAQPQRRYLQGRVDAWACASKKIVGNLPLIPRQLTVGPGRHVVQASVHPACPWLRTSYERYTPPR